MVSNTSNTEKSPYKIFVGFWKKQYQKSTARNAYTIKVTNMFMGYEIKKELCEGEQR